MAYFISDEDFEKATAVGFGYLKMKFDEDYDYWRTIVPRADA
jgi:hypothetical protein